MNIVRKCDADVADFTRLRSRWTILGFMLTEVCFGGISGRSMGGLIVFDTFLVPFFGMAEEAEDDEGTTI